MPKYTIRTTDRNIYRECRQHWDYTSKIRQDWVPAKEAEHFAFGTAIHAALETIYDPKTWDEDRDFIFAEAQIAFRESLQKWVNEITEKFDLASYELERHDELFALGEGMLLNYHVWREAQDNHFTPVRVEQDFSIPIPVLPQYEGIVKYFKPKRNAKGKYQAAFKALEIEEQEGLYLHIYDRSLDSYIPVFYEGTIDLIVKSNFTGNYAIWDHKTAKSFIGGDWLNLNIQASSYFWALTKIGLFVESITFNTLKKAMAEEPKVLESGKLSKNKAQKTSIDLYEAKIMELGLDRNDYIDFLETYEAPTMVYRETTYRTPDQLDVIEHHILTEAMEMLGAPYINPNPNPFRCGRCPFQTACQMRQEGLDDLFYLQNSYSFNKRGKKSEE